MATKYVRADGAATWANANGPETNASNCCSMATAVSNAAADDLVYISGLGGVFRSDPNFSASGSSGSPITWSGTSNVPIFRASVLATGFSVDSGSRYIKTGVTTEPEQLWIDGDFGSRQTSSGACTSTGDWYWASDSLYLYDGDGDPDDRSDPGIEIGARNNAISIGANYLTFIDIIAEHGNRYGWSNWNTSNNIWTGCTGRWNWYDGIAANANTTYSGHVVQDGYYHHNGACGITFLNSGGGSTGHIVRRNTCYENGRFHGDWESAHDWTGGIKFLECGDGQLIEKNIIYSCGPSSGDAEDGQNGKGNGIWLDYTSGTSGTRNVVQFNRIYDCHANGVFIEGDASYNVVLSNVIYDCAFGANWGIWSSAGVRIDSREGESANYNCIFNNTIVGGRFGFLMGTYSQSGGCSVSYNEIKNNIIVGQEQAAIWAGDGGDNDGTYGTGNVYNSNCFGAESTAFISWGVAEYSTYDAWLAASSQTDNNVESDPSFTNAAADDYTLASDSPCIGAGADLGASYDDALLPASTWPDGVVTADQDDY